ncbi:DUF5710 domain-containing protein [Rhodoferax sp.]|uniref:DUF5710 domain-containing protein n=1 Tax=Rhodoferax sp. TaxID=50421 RepID=UPI003421CCDC
MRINLVTPFAEKDAVKALGARWDATKKIWYIVDVADFTPFLRWIPNVAAATEDSTGGTPRPTKSTSKAPINQFKGPTTGAATEVPHCGCNVLPREDCQHAATA